MVVAIEAEDCTFGVMFMTRHQTRLMEVIAETLLIQARQKEVELDILRPDDIKSADQKLDSELRDENIRDMRVRLRTDIREQARLRHERRKAKRKERGLDF